MFFSCMVLACLVISTTPLSWTPQLGTVDHPKTIELSNHARKKDVVKCGHELYKARQPSPIRSADAECIQFLDSSIWRRLDRGTFSYPKILGVDHPTTKGEIFYDEDKKRYMETTCDQVQLSEFSEDSVYKCLTGVHVPSRWMTLLYEDIADDRLGDLALPGSHDSGTAGITEDSYLVDQTFLYNLGELVVPMVIANWSLTQDTFIASQLLEGGKREFDMRIADLQSENDTFRWWHGMASQEIFDDLQAFADFSERFPREIIIINFNSFVRPGNPAAPTLPITNERRDELSDIILGYLEPYMVSSENMTGNPTVRDVLTTGRNIIALMEDNYIRQKTLLYWDSDILLNVWTSASNPEELFQSRTASAKEFRTVYKDTIAELSGCVTPNGRSVSAGMIRVFGDLPWVEEIIGKLLPGDPSTYLNADQMSFEGLFVDLLTLARDGTNTLGMWARPYDLYTSGYSVQYRGTNEMFRYWLARPYLYRVNVFYNDDSVVTSTLAQTAIAANSGNIKPEASITLNGNTLTGYYEWKNSTTEGGDEANYCSDINAHFAVTSQQYAFSESYDNMYEFVMTEGHYPSDTEVVVFVSSPGSELQVLYRANIEALILASQDLYVRGSDAGDGSGFAYISQQYNLFGAGCTEPPLEGYENIVYW